MPTEVRRHGLPPGPFALTALANGWTVGRFAALDAIGSIKHAVTTRQGIDVAKVRNDRQHAADAVAGALGLKEVAWLEQVHSGDVIHVHQGGPAGSADGLVTNVPSLGIIGRSADCPLILVADPVSGVVGMAHASWRGTVKQIAAQLVSVCVTNLRAEPGRMIACICPSAGPCCYEVGQDVVKAAITGIGRQAEAFFIERGGKLYFDLWAANTDQLTQAGLSPDNIHAAGVCTMCRNDIFPSHRLEGDRAGRFLAVIART